MADPQVGWLPSCGLATAWRRCWLPGLLETALGWAPAPQLAQWKCLGARKRSIYRRPWLKENCKRFKGHIPGLFAFPHRFLSLSGKEGPGRGPYFRASCSHPGLSSGLNFSARVSDSGRWAYCLRSCPDWSALGDD
jgi:hypothetical protein